MLRFFRIKESEGEDVDAFQFRVNAEVDRLRDASLVVNIAPYPGGDLTVWAQVGWEEPVTGPQGQIGLRFKDLSSAEVQKKIDARAAALARGAGRLLGS